jgi:Uma2 family endonuclease
MTRSAQPLRRATYEDLCRVPDNMVAEILDGELFATPRPTLPHARAGSALAIEIGGPFDQGRGGPGGWWILIDPELHLADDVVVPDLAEWQRGRLPAVPDAPFLTLAPDWACEIVSPSTEQMDRLRKMRIYARESVADLWLVNPTARTLEAFRLEGPRWVLQGTHGGSEVARVQPFAAIELELARLWIGAPAT